MALGVCSIRCTPESLILPSARPRSKAVLGVNA